MSDLYRMYDRAGRLLYVGISINAGSRAAQHAADKPWWSQVARIDVEHLDCDRETLLMLEERAIRREAPLYNIQHNNPDLYVKAPTARPFNVPYRLLMAPEWDNLCRALGGYVAATRRLYGLSSVCDAGEINSLELLDAVARVAHAPNPCPSCGDDTNVSRVEIAANEYVILRGWCRTCSSNAVTSFDWEFAA